MNRKEYHNAVFEYSDALFRFAVKLCREEALAQDLVQDAYEKVWIKHREINGQKVKSYLFRTVYNKFIDQTRKSRVLSLNEVSEELHYNSPSPDINEVLHQALSQLSDVQRSVVLLRDYEGYNYAEIGEILHLKESQVKVYIFRARKHLQKYIGALETVI